MLLTLKRFEKRDLYSIITLGECKMKEELVDKLIEYLKNENKSLKDDITPSSYIEKRKYLRGLINMRPPMPIDESILELEDKLLELELKEKDITDVAALKEVDNKIIVWQGDITTLKIDAIVNACNSSLLGCFVPNHTCIDNIIHTSAGIRLRLECNSIMKGMEEPNGNARLTKGYNLPSKYVIHTVGPIVNRNVTKENIEDLTNCYKSSLELARHNNIRTIAFPCISTGLFHFPKESAAKIAINTIKDYLFKYPDAFDKIVFNTYLDEDKKIYDEYVREMKKVKMISHLHGDIFEIIKNGTKDIEVRVNDEKRRTLKIGDKILFLNRDDELETIILNVIKLEYYKNFKELVNHYPMERMYLNDYTKEDFLKELARFYTEEEQEEYGVVAIIFERE